MKKYIKNIFSKKWHYLVVGGLLVILIFQYFYGFWIYDYLMPPGDDSLNHLSKAYEISRAGQLEDPVERALLYNEVAYPPVFHILLSAISQITNLNIVIVGQYYIRCLVILLILNLYVLGSKFFQSRLAAIFSLFFLILFCPQPQEIYNEGTYLDLAVANFYLPLTLLFFSLYLKEKKYLFPTILFVGATLLGHHLSAIYFLMIFLLINLILLPLLIFRKNHKIWRLLSIDLGIIVFLFFAWNYYIGNTVNKIWSLIKELWQGQSQLEASANLNFIPTTLSKIPIFDTYVYFLGFTIIFFGLIGIIFLYTNKKIFTLLYPKIILGSWLAVLFAGSRLSVVQLPERFARDLFLPLALLAGYGLFQIYVLLKKYDYRWLSRIGMILLFVVIIINIIPVFKYPKYNLLVRWQDPDDRAIKWIEENADIKAVFLGTPLVSSSWGSFITLLTDRSAIPSQDVAIYEPNSAKGKNFYCLNKIDYVYAGKPFIGPYLWQEQMDYSYNLSLQTADFLSIIFDQSSRHGRVVIYKVNKEKICHEKSI